MSVVADVEASPARAAAGVDSRGRTQYRYHQLWREQRDAQKFPLALSNATPAPSARSRQRVIAASVREVAGWLGDTPEAEIAVAALLVA